MLAAWPTERPIVSLMGNSGWFVIATKFSQLDWTEFRELQPFDSKKTDQSQIPFQCGYIGLVSYDHYAPFTRSLDTTECRVYRVAECLVGNVCEHTLFLARSESTSRERWQVDVDELLVRDVEKDLPDPRWQLLPSEQDDDYLKQVGIVLEDIRSGSYYQLNLLRSFDLLGDTKRTSILARLSRRCEPFGCWFDFDDYKVVSFSPEGFCRVDHDAGQTVIKTTPIKGTIARTNDPISDRRNRAQLASSGKDLSELHMIVDLMRNDLNQICRTGSVSVHAANDILSFRDVHHLQARIHGRLRPRLSVDDVFSAICPSGSITGAPKREVTKAIASMEGHNRGFLMGNAFSLDHRGHLNSSVLIRTMSAKQKDGVWKARFAAGSGLTLRSNPSAELEEINSKMRVITNTC